MGTLQAVIDKQHRQPIYIMTGDVFKNHLRRAIVRYAELDSDNSERTRGVITDLAVADTVRKYRDSVKYPDSQTEAEGPYARCQNCEAVWPESVLDKIVDLHERVWPGEPMPSGDCPVCGALCQRITKKEG